MDLLEDVTFVMHRADSMVLSFNTAASSGYVWDVELQKGLFINQIKSNQGPTTSNEAPLIGGYTKTQFMIMAEAPGEYEVKFEHKRPWSDEISHTKTIKITVK